MPRFRDRDDLEVAGDERPVAKEPTGQGLLDLDRPHPGERHRRGAPAEDPVGDEELLGRQDDVRPVPAENGRDRYERREAEQDRADRRKRPAAEKRAESTGCEEERTEERAHENDPVTPRFEANPLLGDLGHGLSASPQGEKHLAMDNTARRAATATLVALSIIVTALALWKIKAVIALLLLGIILAAAMRPGVDSLHKRYRVPRGIGVLLHYVVLFTLIGLVLWLVVPRAISQVQQGIGNVPTSTSELEHAANHSTGIKHDILSGLDKRLRRLPSGTSLIHRAVTITKTAFEVLVGIFFVFAVGGYWIFERDKTIALVQSMVPQRHRRVVRDTWLLIDDKLGAFVRGQAILILFVAALLSFAFWLDGEPYYLLIGAFAGVVEIVPILGPLAAGVLAVSVGFTVDWQTALGAGIAVLAVRMAEDYVVVPRVLGHAVGLSPLLVLVSVTSIGILLGGFYVLLAIPIAAVTATLVDVIVRDQDPAEQEVPPILFPAKDAEVEA